MITILFSLLIFKIKKMSVLCGNKQGEKKN
jgi:hypothetical protein